MLPELIEIQRVRQGERLKIFRKSLGLNQGEMANLLTIQQGSYADIERGRNQVTTKIVHFLVENYNLDANWLLNGIGEMFLKGRFDRVTICPYFVNAGETLGYSDEWVTAPIKVSVPGVDLDSFAFQVRGDSMIPLVYDGDYIICTREISLNNVISGGTYVLATRQGLYLKKVLRLGKKIRLLSINKRETPPIELSLSEVFDFYSPFRRITKLDFLHDDIQMRVEKIETFLINNFGMSI